jgi:hypothetical protein
MANESGRKESKRTLLFSLGGVGLVVMIGCLSLFLSNVLGANRADGWDVPESNLEIAFYIREGATWQDGRAITADDVVSSFNAVLLNAGNRSEASAPMIPDGAILKCEKVDDYCVKFTMSAASREGPNTLRFDIVSKATLAEYILTLGPSVPAEALREMLIPE